jgi:hypothetical protein
MHLLKELYLSVFLLFFRITLWKGRMKASMAAICVSVVEGLLALTLWTWVQTITHLDFEPSRWIILFFFLLIAGPGDYFLVVRGHGEAFDKQFQHFGKSKRIALYVAATCVVALTGIAFYLSATAFHRAFNIG